MSTDGPHASRSEPEKSRDKLVAELDEQVSKARRNAASSAVCCIICLIGALFCFIALAVDVVIGNRAIMGGLSLTLVVLSAITGGSCVKLLADVFILVSRRNTV